MPVAYPTQAKDRFEVYRFFNGLAAEGTEVGGYRREWLRRLAKRRRTGVWCGRAA